MTLKALSTRLPRERQEHKQGAQYTRTTALDRGARGVRAYKRHFVRGFVVPQHGYANKQTSCNFIAVALNAASNLFRARITTLGTACCPRPATGRIAVRLMSTGESKPATAPFR